MDFTSYFHRYGAGKKLYLVIHAEDLEQVRRNVLRAVHAGADGVFLINHTMDHQELLDIYCVIRANHPDMFIGLNCLDLSAEKAFAAVQEVPDVSALWTDFSGITESAALSATLLLQQMQQSDWNGLYFPSTAFKGQSHVYQPDVAATVASGYGHVTVTSGPGTGHAPNVEKIASMKAGAPEHPLAIASGVDISNVDAFLPYADVFMVATGVSDSHTELNELQSKALAQRIHAY